MLRIFWFCWQLGHLTLEDYQIWSVKSALANEFLNLLFQVSTPYTAAWTFVSVKIPCFVHLCVCLHAGLPHSPRPQAWHSWGGGPNHQVCSCPLDSLLYYVLEYVVWLKKFYCCCCVQGLVRAGEQTWAAARSELVPHLHAVVAAVEGLCQIRKSCWRTLHFTNPKVIIRPNCPIFSLSHVLTNI